MPLRARVHAAEGTGQLLMFRVGDELFAADLACMGEVVELDETVQPLPGMATSMLGVVPIRERATPLYSTAAVLGVALVAPAVALVMRRGGRSVALAVDEVADVLDVDFTTVRPAPDDDDGIALGVVLHGAGIVTLVDWDALVECCLAGRVPERI